MGGCFVTMTLDDGGVVASDRIERKGEAFGFCNFMICAMRLHDPAALIVVNLDSMGEADLIASLWLKSLYARAPMTAREMFIAGDREQAAH